MKEVVIDTIIDSLKLLPFLLVAFLIIELIEHKVNNQQVIKKAGKFGPILGSFLGIVPQCGFSVSATNLYATRIISLGTLISIYLSTSDEMLPVLISKGSDINLILKIILLKLMIGMLFGFIIDLIFRKKDEMEITTICEKEHCNCEHGIIKSSIKHTLNIFLFIFVISFIINMGFEYLGEETLSNILMKNSIFSPFITSFLGLIPSCGSSVAITEFYLNNTITFGSMMAGLLTGSGAALMVLFKINRNIKENMKIIGIIYLVGAISGLIIDLI